MRAHRTTVPFTVDQAALLAAEADLTGNSVASSIRKAVATSYAHHRGSDEYRRAVKRLRKIGDDDTE